MIGPAHNDMAKAHKARLERIASKAYRPPEVIALTPIDEPDPTPPCAVRVPWFEDHRITVENVKLAVAKDFGLTPHHLESGSQRHVLVVPRQIAIYLARELTLRSVSYIASRFGGRDHTTAIHACKKISRLMSEDTAFAARVEAIKDGISSERCA